MGSLANVHEFAWALYTIANVIGLTIGEKSKLFRFNGKLANTAFVVSLQGRNTPSTCQGGQRTGGREGCPDQMGFQIFTLFESKQGRLQVKVPCCQNIPIFFYTFCDEVRCRRESDDPDQSIQLFFSV